MRKFISSIFLVLIFSCVAKAQVLELDLKPEGLYVKNITTANLQKLFSDFSYDDFVLPENKYPPIFVVNFPKDFKQTESKDLRNKLFIQILAPLALRLKEEIILERLPLMQMSERYNQQQSFSPEDKELLEKMAVKYDVFSKIKDDSRYEILLQELLLKVDEVPPSLLIAAAAAESNWGTADEVEGGNALYKAKVWYSDEGIKPKDEDDDSYRIRIFPSLYAAMYDYALKFNTDINFENFRINRSHLRKRNKTPRGRVMVYNMVIGSPLQNFAGLISYILTFYDLINVDEGSLKSVKQMMEKK